MSERINVDHAFDPEARQAQTDFDAYMESRTYKDKNEVPHNPNGDFVNSDKYYEDGRENHYNESLEQGDYSGESLEQLAQRVADARAEGDKTRANDAEDAFFAKFSAYADKYGWENEDDSANDLHIDKDAKLGRSIIDDRLDRYSSIMYGEAAEAKTDDDKDVEHDVESAGEDDHDQEVEAEERDDSKAESDESVDVPAPVKHEYEVEDEPLISLDDLEPINEPNEQPALDGESLDEYEARNGAGDEKNDFIDTAGLEPVDESADPIKVRSNRLRDRLLPNKLFHRAKAASHSLNERRNSKDDKEKMKTSTKIGIGVLAVAITGGGIYLAYKSGVNLFSGEASATDPDGDKKTGKLAQKAQELFGDGSVDVRAGDGSTQVLDRVLSAHDIQLNSNELYDLHQHLEAVKAEYINLDGANDTYSLPNGDSGLSRPDADAHISDKAQKAAVRWLQANGKL